MSLLGRRSGKRLAALDSSELAALAIAGRADAMEALLVAHSDAMSAVVQAVAGRQHRDDALQSAMEKAVGSISQLRDPARARAWLCQIARNAARDVMAQRVTVVLGDAEVADVRSHDWAYVAGRVDIDVALRELDERSRMVILLRLAEFTESEIADTLGVPVGTARTWIRRSRLELAERVGR